MIATDSGRKGTDVLIAALLMLLVPDEVYMAPAGKEYNAWLTCAYNFAEKVDDRRELVGTIADAALTHCTREQGEYWSEWMRVEGWDTMRAPQIGDTQIGKDRAEIRARLIERRLAARAGLTAKKHRANAN